MTLERNDDGSHRWVPPNQPYVGARDAQGRDQQIGALVTEPLGAVHVSNPQPVKQHNMRGYEVVTFQAELYDSRGTWQQEGPLPRVHSGYSENEMVGDAPYVMRHPMAVVEQPLVANDLVATTDVIRVLQRVVSATFRGQLFVAVPPTSSTVKAIWTEDSATNPAMEKVATYAPHANNSVPLCMKSVIVAGSEYLFVGYMNASGAGLGCEAFAGTTLTPAIQVDTSDGHAGTPQGVYGIVQGPDGSIMVTNLTGDILICRDTTVTPGNLVFEKVQSQAMGYFGYAVGNLSLSNYAPAALWWRGHDSQNSAQFLASTNNGDQTPRGVLNMVSYDGLQVDPLDFPDLPYVSIATIYRGGCVACDRKDHYWYTGTAMKSMDGGSRRAHNSHKSRLCCGHRAVGDKLLRIEVEIDDRFDINAPDALYNTTARVIEYDPYLGRERPISKPVDLGFGDNSIVVGALPELPWSPNTRNLHWVSMWEFMVAAVYNTDFGSWWRQYQPPNNTPGFDSRSTDSDTSGGAPGFAGYDDDVTYTSPVFTHHALQGFEYTPIRVIGPRVESLREGGDSAYLDVSIGGYDGQLRANEPDVKYPTALLGDWQMGRTWSTALQLELTSHLGTGVTHKTQNVWPITVEVVARRPILEGIRL
jgi:hypothetical protein